MPNMTVRIYRGITGAGKSHWANHWIRTGYQGPASSLRTLSADHFWVDSKTKEYRFDPTRIGEAHAWCFRCYLDALREAFYRCLVVDNTNLHAWELAPYVQAANAYGVAHQIVTVWCDPAVAVRRNVHGVPAKVVFAMHQTLVSERLPGHWNHEVLYPEGNP